MPWYQVKIANQKEEIHYAKSAASLTFQFIRQKQWHVQICPWRPHYLNYATLLLFYQEIQSALTSGLQLHEAIKHLSMSSRNRNICLINKALLSELNKGRSFNNLLASLSLTMAAPYCQLINTKGTREDCIQSLTVSIQQLNGLLNWSQRLLKACAYPFCVIQIALVIALTNTYWQTPDDNNMVLAMAKPTLSYLVTCTAQIYLIFILRNGTACFWLEKISPTFRLAKIFSILSNARKTGNSLQQSLLNLHTFLTNQNCIDQSLEIYYQLKLGQSYVDSFPESWFPGESHIALHSAEQDGDLERALQLAARKHENHWQQKIIFLEKLIPAVCLMIAGSFVANTLIAIYQPLFNLS
ncbi:secretion system protein [Marinomonas sp. THO17]|uniref:secretion system protein n=1 Tax=Marinomonas sp. THO17 TaxID=3149048 RepID=UPI00336BE3D4